MRGLPRAGEGRRVAARLRTQVGPAGKAHESPRGAVRLGCGKASPECGNLGSARRCGDPRPVRKPRGSCWEWGGRAGTWLWGKGRGQLIKGTGRSQKSWAERPGEEGSSGHLWPELGCTLTHRLPSHEGHTAASDLPSRLVQVPGRDGTSPHRTASGAEARSAWDRRLGFQGRSP